LGFTILLFRFVSLSLPVCHKFTYEWKSLVYFMRSFVSCISSVMGLASKNECTQTAPHLVLPTLFHENRQQNSCYLVYSCLVLIVQSAPKKFPTLKRYNFLNN